MALTQKQRAERIGYIGGTDAAAVLGLSRYKSPLGLWSEKTGAIIPKDRDGELPILIGNMLEDVVAELYTIKTGTKLQRVKEILVHPEYPFIRCQIDRVTVGLADREIVECKTASAFKIGEWEGDDVPSEYIVQVLHQLMVMGAIAKSKGLPVPPRAHLAVLIGGNVDFIYKTVERDEEMIDELLKKEVAFWNENVIGKKMPAVTDHDDSTLAALFPLGKEQEEPMALPEECEAMIERIHEIGTDTSGEMGALKKEKSELQNNIRLALGESSYGVVGPYKATWKNQDKNTLDTKTLAAEKPEVYAKYLKTTTIRVLLTPNPNKKKGDK